MDVRCAPPKREQISIICASRKGAITGTWHWSICAGLVTFAAIGKRNDNYSVDIFAAMNVNMALSQDLLVGLLTSAENYSFFLFPFMSGCMVGRSRAQRRAVNNVYLSLAWGQLYRRIYLPRQLSPPYG